MREEEGVETRTDSIGFYRLRGHGRGRAWAAVQQIASVCKALHNRQRNGRCMTHSFAAAPPRPRSP